jgi:hypothetical protein
MSLHSLLLVGSPIKLASLCEQLNTLLDPSYDLVSTGGCIHEIFEIHSGTYLIVIKQITPLLTSLYINLYNDDARILFKNVVYTVSIADKTHHRYLSPTHWQTSAPYRQSNIILYKIGSIATYTCEYYEFELICNKCNDRV